MLASLHYPSLSLKLLFPLPQPTLLFLLPQATWIEGLKLIQGTEGNCLPTKQGLCELWCCLQHTKLRGMNKACSLKVTEVHTSLIFQYTMIAVASHSKNDLLQWSLLQLWLYKPQFDASTKQPLLCSFEAMTWHSKLVYRGIPLVCTASVAVDQDPKAIGLFNTKGPQRLHLRVFSNGQECTFHKKANCCIEQIGFYIQWLFLLFFSVYRIYETLFLTHASLQ